MRESYGRLLLIIVAYSLALIGLGILALWYWKVALIGFVTLTLAAFYDTKAVRE